MARFQRQASDKLGKIRGDFESSASVRSLREFEHKFDANQNGRAGLKWIGATIVGGVLYDKMKDLVTDAEDQVDEYTARLEEAEKALDEHKEGSLKREAELSEEIQTLKKQLAVEKGAREIKDKLQKAEKKLKEEVSNNHTVWNAIWGNKTAAEEELKKAVESLENTYLEYVILVSKTEDLTEETLDASKELVKSADTVKLDYKE